MAEITRQVGDVSPNTFIRQGVRDDSLATAVKGLGEGAMAIDSGLAKRRFDKAQEMLHAQYVVGSPSSAALVEDSPSDVSPLSPGDERSLKDFKSILDTQSGARDQGKMNYSSYQLRAERLLRVAIAKRPGLASEFRSIAGAYVGTDVTGAESRFLADAENQAAKDAAALADKDDKLKMKLYNDQIELFKSVDMPGYAMFGGPDDPQYQAWFQANAPVLQAKLATQGKLKIAQQAVELQDASKSYNADANTELWVAQAENSFSKAAGLGDVIRTQLKISGGEKDPMQIRLAYEQAAEGVRAELAQLEVDGQKYGVPASTQAVYRERGAALLTKMEGVISGTDDKKLMENHNDLLVSIERSAMLSNDEFRQTSVMMKDLPAAMQERLTAKMEKTFVLTAAEMLQDTATPERIARQAPDMLPQMVAAIFPNGSSTPADPVAAARFHDIATRAVASYITQDDGSFAAAKFTQHPVSNTPGTLKVLDNHAAAILPSLNPAQRQELTTTVAAAAGNSLRVLAMGMNTKYPSLMNKVAIDMDFPGGRAFVLKPGITEAQLTVTERQGLGAYNRAANAPLILKVLKAYGGLPGSAEASQLIKESYQPGQALKASGTPKKERPASGSRGSSGSGSTARPAAPEVGAVIKGYRYKGGDPGSRSSWEPV